MHVKRGELRIKTEEWAHLIVHASKVCMVGNVEALGCQLQFCLLANFMLPSQAHIEIGVVRAKSSVTAGSDRTFVGGRSEEHTSELQSHLNLVCRLLLEKK